MSSRRTGRSTRPPRHGRAASSGSVGGSVFVPTNAATVSAREARAACSASRAPGVVPRPRRTRGARRSRSSARSRAFASRRAHAASLRQISASERFSASSRTANARSTRSVCSGKSRSTTLLARGRERDGRRRGGRARGGGGRRGRGASSVADDLGRVGLRGLQPPAQRAQLELAAGGREDTRTEKPDALRPSRSRSADSRRRTLASARSSDSSARWASGSPGTSIIVAARSSRSAADAMSAGSQLLHGAQRAAGSAGVAPVERRRRCARARRAACAARRSTVLAPVSGSAPR